jgi:hypothetical protein
MRFVLNREPVAPAEAAVLELDLRRHDLDDRYWGSMNGFLTTGSRSDTPLALRAYRGERLVGVACLFECRRTNRCFFPGRLGSALDLAPLPLYCWTRGDPAVDLMSNPGFVAPGEDRHSFYEGAIAYLNRRYVMGCVMEERNARPAAECFETPVMDWGRYDVRPGGTDLLLGSHKHLRRKESRFHNKGGRLEVVVGALSPADRDGVLHCLHQSAGFALVRAPFQENYAHMVRWAAASGAPGLVHILARIDGDLVGYHAFLQSGGRLQCLSGGFDRTRPSTYHAYENILLHAMRYAEAHGLRQVAFGPVGNPSKSAVMPAFGHFALRF